jgi:hypothetical protein
MRCTGGRSRSRRNDDHPVAANAIDHAESTPAEPAGERLSSNLVQRPRHGPSGGEVVVASCSGDLLIRQGLEPRTQRQKVSTALVVLRDHTMISGSREPGVNPRG